VLPLLSGPRSGARVSEDKQSITGYRSHCALSIQMSVPTSAATPKIRYMVYAPDCTDEGALERRLSVRSKHLEVAAANIAAGITRVGAVLLSPESVDREDKKMVGSMFICEVDSLEEAKKVVESDIYYTAGVWDKEKIVILPCIVAAPAM